MALFKKKEKKTCAICGKELGFLNSTGLSDGNAICDDCAKRVEDSLDSVGGATLDQVKAVLARQEQEIAAAREKLAELGDFQSCLAVEDFYSISPKATDVGIKRAKLLKDRMVVSGPVRFGSFQNGDAVTLIHEGQKRSVTLLECYRRDASDLMTELGANLQKKGVREGDQAWLILDLGDGVSHGDLVAK